VLDSLPVPLIGRVHGAALGGGAGLVAVCDIVVAADDAVFAFSETKLGILPAVIAPYVLAKMGASAARELFLTGARFGAARREMASFTGRGACGCRQPPEDYLTSARRRRGVSRPAQEIQHSRPAEAYHHEPDRRPARSAEGQKAWSREAEAGGFARSRAIRRAHRQRGEIAVRIAAAARPDSRGSLIPTRTRCAARVADRSVVLARGAGRELPVGPGIDRRGRPDRGD
jgi:hypothetical protein